MFQGQRAVQQVRQCGTISLEVHLLPLDLASLDSVRHFATEVQRICPKVDILVNNAGGEIYGIFRVRF